MAHALWWGGFGLSSGPVKYQELSLVLISPPMSCQCKLQWNLEVKKSSHVPSVEIWMWLKTEKSIKYFGGPLPKNLFPFPTFFSEWESMIYLSFLHVATLLSINLIKNTSDPFSFYQPYLWKWLDFSSLKGRLHLLNLFYFLSKIIQCF